MKSLSGIRKSLIAATAIATLQAGIGAYADMLEVEDLKPWEVCAMCHGLSGTSAVDRFPHLAGQKPSYLVKQIQDFQSGYRTNDGGQMQSTVQNLNHVQIQEVADYFSAQPRQTSEPVENKQLWLQGKALYKTGKSKKNAIQCASCHEPSANNQVPILLGQKKEYLLKQMQDFRHGKRTAVPVMQALLLSFNEQETQALAYFLSTQNAPESLVIKTTENGDF